MPGLVPGIHVFAAWRTRKTWMAGTSPAMTKEQIVFQVSSRFPRKFLIQFSKSQFQTRIRDPAARCARVVDKSFAQRGRGERRVPVAPAASCALGIGKKHTSKRVPRNHPAFPHAMVLTVSFALPGDRALLPPSSRNWPDSPTGKSRGSIRATMFANVIARSDLPPVVVRRMG